MVRRIVGEGLRAVLILAAIGGVGLLSPAVASAPCSPSADDAWSTPVSQNRPMDMVPTPCRTAAALGDPTATSGNLGVWDPATLECPGDTGRCAGGTSAL